MKKITLILFITFLTKSIYCQWTPQVSGVGDQLFGVQFLNENEGYCWSDAGFCLKTTNGGTNWNIFPEAAWVGYIEFLNQDTVLGLKAAATDSNNVVKSTDGGMTWNTIFTSPNLYSSFHFTTTSIYYVTTLNATWDTITMYKTINGGLNWNMLSTFPGAGSLLYFKDANTGFFSYQAGQLLRTSDGGANWNLVSTAAPGGIYKIYFPSTNIGYATSGNSYLKTTDGGLNWSETTLSFTGPYYSIDCSDTNTCYIVGGDGFSTGTIIKTTDGGTNWISSPTTCVLLYDIDFASDTIGYTCGLTGTILKYGNSGLGFQDLPLTSFEIYPNPARDFISLKIQNLNIENISGIIYDKAGRQVLEIENVLIDKMIHLTNLEAGEYFLQLFSEKEKYKAEKFIIIR